MTGRIRVWRKEPWLFIPWKVHCPCCHATWRRAEWAAAMNLAAQHVEDHRRDQP